MNKAAPNGDIGHMPQITFSGLTNHPRHFSASNDSDHHHLNHAHRNNQSPTTSGATYSAKPATKILGVAKDNSVAIRYGCGSCRCGTCAIKLTSGSLSLMQEDEKELLKDMEILDGNRVRLSCRARLTHENCTVDLNYQNQYDPSRRRSKDQDIVPYVKKERKKPKVAS